MSTRDALRTVLGPVGVWAALDGVRADEILRFAQAVEDLGFPALWINEGSGREPFALLGSLARVTSRLTLGLGVATIYARDAMAARAGARTISDLADGRFVMGLGVSHRSSANARGHAYDVPLTTMRAYLDSYEKAPWSGPAVTEPSLVLAALGPKMLALAATRTAGAFPYLVSASMVRDARRTLDATIGPGDERPVLVVSLEAVLGDGPDVREAARATIARYMGQPNYRNNLARGGFSDADMDTVSDRLVDALVAVGGTDELRERVAAMREAGADHVAVIPLSAAGRQASLETARAVAP